MFNEASLVLEPPVLRIAPDCSSCEAPPDLVAARSAVLARHGWRAQSRSLHFSLPGDRVALLATARILAMDSPEEIWSSERQIFRMESPGKLCPKRQHHRRLERERRAWRLVCKW